MSPFLGLSLLTHLVICFIYETAIFAHGLVFGFGSHLRRRISVLNRTRDERLLPTFVVVMVVSTVMGMAYTSVLNSYHSKPNTIDMVLNSANYMWASDFNILPQIEELNKKMNPLQKDSAIVFLNLSSP